MFDKRRLKSTLYDRLFDIPLTQSGSLQPAMVSLRSPRSGRRR